MTPERKEQAATYRDFRGNKPEVKFVKGGRFYKAENGDIMFAFRADVGSEFVSKATDEQKAAARKTALYASRTNYILSIPMLMCMAGATHGLPF